MTNTESILTNRILAKTFSFNEMRAAILFIFVLLFQIVIIVQNPFLQIDFIWTFYTAVLLFFSHHLFIYTSGLQKNVISYAFDFAVLFYLFKSHPYFSSFYLVVILILLFLAGLDLSRLQAVFLTFICSMSLSILNLFVFRWSGTQNLLSLALFNLSFVSVVVISLQLRSELAYLSQTLSKTSRKLKSQADLSQILIEKIPTGLLALNSKMQTVFSNKTLTGDLGMDHPMALELVQSHRNEKHFETQAYNPKFADKRHYEIDSAFYFDEDLSDQINLYLIKDVTELRNLQDQVKQKEKLAAIGQLAAGIAHEIRNPLAGISGSIELLSNDQTNPDDQKLMKIILREIDRLNNLITDFLDYSKPEKRPDQKVDVSFILDEIIQNVKLSAVTPIALKYDVQMSKAVVMGFSDKLKQALMNIVMNAVQAMKDVSEPILKIRTEISGHVVLLRIADNGQGMSEETRKRIFEPFFTTKAKGTGLGLAVTHKILEAHHAEVTIDSEIGKGSEFKIIFKKIEN